MGLDVIIYWINMNKKKINILYKYRDETIMIKDCRI